MPYCPNCGEKVPKKTDFCPGCGTRIYDKTQVDSSDWWWEKDWGKILISLVVLFIVAFMIFIYFSSIPPETSRYNVIWHKKVPNGSEGLIKCSVEGNLSEDEFEEIAKGITAEWTNNHPNYSVISTTTSKYSKSTADDRGLSYPAYLLTAYVRKES